MSKNASGSEESTDLKDEYGPFGEPDVDTLGGALDKALADHHSVLGVDMWGETHHWDSQANVVYVVAPRELAITVDLQGRDLAEYLQFVDERRGWV